MQNCFKIYKKSINCIRKKDLESLHLLPISEFFISYDLKGNLCTFLGGNEFIIGTFNFFFFYIHIKIEFFPVVSSRTDLIEIISIHGSITVFLNKFFDVSFVGKA